MLTEKNIQIASIGLIALAIFSGLFAWTTFTKDDPSKNGPSFTIGGRVVTGAKAEEMRKILYSDPAFRAQMGGHIDQYEQKKTKAVSAYRVKMFFLLLLFFSSIATAVFLKIKTGDSDRSIRTPFWFMHFSIKEHITATILLAVSCVMLIYSLAELISIPRYSDIWQSFLLVMYFFATGMGLLSKINDKISKEWLRISVMVNVLASIFWIALAVDLCKGHAAIKSIFSLSMVILAISVYTLTLKELEVFKRFTFHRWAVEDIVVLTAFNFFKYGLWGKSGLNLLQSMIMMSIGVGTFIAWTMFLIAGFQNTQEIAPATDK